MPDSLLVVPYAEHDAALNMALDAVLLAHPPGTPVLRLYGWRPSTLSLGRFQSPDARLRGALAELCASGEAQVVRRATGGGAIWHHGELTYSVVGTLASLHLTGDPGAAYARFHRAWAAALAGVARIERARLFMPAGVGDAERSEGAERFLCFTRRTAYDVLVAWEGARARGVGDAASERLRAVLEAAAVEIPEDALAREGKIIGSAQRRRQGVLMQHGSIKLLPSVFGPWDATLCDFAPWAAERGVAGLAEELVERFADHLGYRLVRWSIAPELMDEATRVAREWFATPRWTWDARR